MKQLIHGKIVLPDRIIEDGSIIFSDRIEKILENNATVDGAEVIDLGGNTVIPGLIDLHIHGYLGADASDGDVEGIERMAEGIAKNGVTAFLPTTMTLSYAELEKAFNSIREAKKKGTPKGAEILGIHAEGPFINPERCGAQPKEYAVPPDAEFVEKHSDIIKIMTVAPEMDADHAVIRRIKSKTDVILSIGHTATDYEGAMASFNAGVTHATHLFNAMTAMTHRAPGVVGAALSCPCVSCELICDTFHINPALFSMVHKLKGRKFNLITDCMRAGGLPDGVYELGGQTVTVNGIKCLLANGVIAGSVLKLNEAVRNAYNHGLTLCEAVNSASLYPAEAIGADGERGSLTVGKRADIVVCDENFNIQKTYRDGNEIYSV